MAGFHSEYHKNAVILVDKITGSLYFNDAELLLFVQHLGHCSNFPVQSWLGKLQRLRLYLGWFDSTMLKHAGNIINPLSLKLFLNV